MVNPEPSERSRRALVAYGLFVLALYAWAGTVTLPKGNVVKDWGYTLSPGGFSWDVASVDPVGPAAGAIEPGDAIGAIDGDARVAVGCVWAVTDAIPPERPYTIEVSRGPSSDSATLVMHLHENSGKVRTAWVLFAVGLTFLLVGLFVAAFSRGTDAARFMCVTWITLAFGLLSQSFALVRDALGPIEIAVGVVAFPALLAALALGYTFAYRFPWGVPRSRVGGLVGLALVAWAATTGVALVVHSVTRASGVPLRAPFGVPYPAFFLATNLSFQTYIAAAGLAMCVVSVRNYRKAAEPGLRRRAKWLIVGTVAGVAPFTAVQVVNALATSAAALRLAGRLDRASTALLVLLPALVAYGIATERLFDVRVVVRRGIQYLLARNLLRTAVAVQWVALIYAVASHLDVTIREALEGSAWLIVLLAVTAASLRYNRTIAAWIDRRFFREALDVERTLAGLAGELERVEELGEAAGLALVRLDATLHPKVARVLFRGVEGGFERWPGGVDDSIPPPEGEEADLVVPMTAADGSLAGALVLGERRSEQPYSATDRRLLADIAGRMAAAWERVRLTRRLEIEQRASRESREREREAEAAERRARDENRAKSLFLAAMSHELRTPLNAVLGFAQLMRRDASLGAENREYLATILRSGEHLLGLINDVLSIAKIEAGKLTLSVQPFDLPGLLVSVEEMVRVRAESKGVAFAVERAEGLPVAALGDGGKLRQVLLNLLGNAVKFTSAGSVTLRVAWADGRASFEVEDTGSGIAADELEKLFVPFEQTESGRAAGEGTGLGLAISREMVRLMGGDVRVASEPGRGTTFAFDVHMPAASGAEATAAPPPDDAAVTAERLAAMPAELLDELRTALTAGDVVELRRVVDRISAGDPILAEGLASAVRAYRYDALLDLAERAGS